MTLPIELEEIILDYKYQMDVIEYKQQCDEEIQIIINSYNEILEIERQRIRPIYCCKVADELLIIIASMFLTGVSLALIIGIVELTVWLFI